MIYNVIFRRFFLILTLCCIFFVARNVKADSCNDKSVLNVVIKNPQGDYIKNANVIIYEQNGNNLGDKLMSKNTDDSGLASFSFKSNNGIFVVRVNPPNSNNNSFYFYNESLSCGDTGTVTLYLSSILFKMHDINDRLVKDIDFSVYIQKKDAENNPIALDDYKVGDFHIGEQGSLMVYVPNKTRTLGGNFNNKYLLKIHRNNVDFFQYDISVNDGSFTIVDYYFSGMKLSFRDSDNIDFPKNVNVNIYKQYDASTLGEKIDSVKTDSGGNVFFEYSAGTYVAEIDNNGPEYFWNLQIDDNTTKNYILKTKETWFSNDDNNCDNSSNLSIKVKDLDGNSIDNMYYEIYTQGVDANNNPIADKRIKSGNIGKSGIINVSFKPSPQVKYVLSLSNKNYKDAKFWYYNDIQFKCGENKNITKYLPYFKVIIRDTNGQLVKNQNFDIYTQKYDEDSNPIKDKKDKIGSFNTGETGNFKLYLPSYDKYGNTHSNYVMTLKRNKAEYIKYNIDMVPNENNTLEYTLSDIVLNIKNASGKVFNNKQIYLYNQEIDVDGHHILKSKLTSGKTDVSGNIIFQYPSGYYAIVLDDNVGNNIIFWDVYINNETRTNKKLITNSVKIRFFNNQKTEKNDVSIKLYLLNEDSSGYYRGEKVKILNLKNEKDRDVSLKSGPYLAVYKDEENHKEYGKAFWVKNGKIYNISIYHNLHYVVSEEQHFKLIKPKTTILPTLSERLAGYILLQVENNGEVWYVDKDAKKRHYLKNGKIAYSIMKSFGLGISNDDLNKIPVGFLDGTGGIDTDGDGLSDKLEESLGLNLFTVDTDGDGYTDKVELENGYNPNGSGKMKYDYKLVNKLKGQILLQVEDKGQAWYLNPQDGKRYYMKDGNDAFEVMRHLSLGISNANLEKINI